MTDLKKKTKEVFQIKASHNVSNSMVQIFYSRVCTSRKFVGELRDFHAGCFILHNVRQHRKSVITSLMEKAQSFKMKGFLNAY